MRIQSAAIVQSQSQHQPERNAVSLLRLMLSRLTLAFSVWHERRVLRTVSDETLEDLGIDRRAALQESGRRFYDLPVNRVR